jgi:hypothetical protein
MIATADAWGPFARDLDTTERLARLRALRQTARLLVGPRAANFCRLLAQAETDPAVLEPACRALDRLAVTDSREILASYAALARSVAQDVTMSKGVQFPRARFEARTSGIRVSFLSGRRCIERLEAGDVIDRRFMPAQSEAERIAARISRRDKVMMLTALRSRPRSWPSFHRCGREQLRRTRSVACSPSSASSSSGAFTVSYATSRASLPMLMQLYQP